MVRMAKCCKPIPGDDIVGYISLGKGITIHRRDCKNARALMKNPERFTKVGWQGLGGMAFRVEIKVEALDRNHLLEDLARTLSDSGVNIIGGSMQTLPDGVVRDRFTLEVGDVRQLDNILANIRSIHTVYDAYRVVGRLRRAPRAAAPARRGRPCSAPSDTLCAAERRPLEVPCLNPSKSSPLPARPAAGQLLHRRPGRDGPGHRPRRRGRRRHRGVHRVRVRAGGRARHARPLRPLRRRRRRCRRHFDIPVYVGAADAGQMADGGLGAMAGFDIEPVETAHTIDGRADARPAHRGARHPHARPLARLVHVRHRRGAAVRRRPALPGQRRAHRPARRRHGPAAQLRRRRWCGASRRTPPCTAATARTRRSAASWRSTRSSRRCATTRSTAGERAARPQGHLRPAAGRGRAARRRRRHGGARLRRLRLPPHRHARVRGDRAVRARRRRGHRHRAQGDVHVRRQGRPLADAAPRGHGAHLPRLRRARHAQAAAAGEALVLLPDVPLRAAAGRPLPRALPDRRRGHRLGRPGGRRRGHRSCWRAIFAELGVEGVTPQHEQHGRRRLPARPTSRSCASTCAAARASSAATACERIDLNPLRTFDCKVESCRAVLDEAPRISRPPVPGVPRALRRRARAGPGAPGSSRNLDFRLVRGLDYYTRTTFEFNSDRLGAQSGVGGGGRYDGLVEQIGGPPTPGVGWGSGLERIALAMREPPRSPRADRRLRGQPSATSVRAGGLRPRPELRARRHGRRAGPRRAQPQGPAQAGRPQRRPLRGAARPRRARRRRRARSRTMAGGGEEDVRRRRPRRRCVARAVSESEA